MRARGGVLALALALVAGCGEARRADVLVVYAAVDRTTAEPLIDAFERAFEVDVRAVFDSEAAKTAGLAKRLELERAHPRADVWWSGEALYTCLLDERGCFEPLGDWLACDARVVDLRGRGWIGFAARLRVLVWRRDRWLRAAPPGSLADLADPALRGVCVLARPTVGTAATHAGWLAASDAGRALLEAIAANGALVVAGNAHVVAAVQRGQALLGLTDSDDALIACAEDPLLAFALPSGAAVLMPSTAAVVRGARNAELARAFVRFLASAQAEELLAASRARHVPLAREAAAPRELPALGALELAPIDYAALARRWPEVARWLDAVFRP